MALQADYSLDNLLPDHTRSLAVGFSGGADSFTLLHMTVEWSRAHNITVHAMTVDHGLRPESAAEASALQNWCAAQNIQHHILPWIGPKPTSAIQDSARIVRRRLLCNACRAHDIPVLLLGHQRDDQAETVLMRLLRGTGLTGLRAMQADQIDAATDVRIVRPLLNESRAALREYCVTHALPFIDDPSNDNPIYERVRMRRILQQLPAISEKLTLTLDRLARADQALDNMTHDWITQHRVHSDDSQWIPKDAFDALDAELRIRIVAHMARTHSATRIRLKDIEALEQRITQPDFKGCTLGGLWIQPKKYDKQAGYALKPAPQRTA